LPVTNGLTVFAVARFVLREQTGTVNLRRRPNFKMGSDKPVFRLPDGTVTKNLNQTFRAFMNETGLLKDPKTGQNRTLYSLRHMYATFAIVHGNVDLHLLSRQMGTSMRCSSSTTAIWFHA
jgi:integrase